MKTEKSIVIIGAGISGLTIAYWLKKSGYDVTVLEQTGRTGGSIQTEKTGGFLIDLGPNSTLETSQKLTQLISDLGLDHEKVYASSTASNRYIVKRGALIRVPAGPLGFFKTPLFSPMAKIRLLKEPFIPRTRAADISLADFVRRRLGSEILDYAINPFVAGVYAGDPERLSTPAAFPKLFALEQNYGSLIRGAFLGTRERKKRGEVAKDRARLFSFRAGMQTLTDRLTAKLEEEIITGVTIDRISRSGKGFELSISSKGKFTKRVTGKLVLSVPAGSMAQLLRDLSPKASGLFKQIDYPPVAVVFMGFKAEDVGREPDGFGFLVPEVEKLEILGSIWSSTIFPARAPDGYVAFTTFVGGTRQPHLTETSEEDLIERVVRNLQPLVKLKAKPVFTRVKVWKKAIPQYNMGYGSIQKTFESLQSEIPGLYFAGNLQRGISVGDSVLSAEKTLQNILRA